MEREGGPNHERVVGKPIQNFHEIKAAAQKFDRTRNESPSLTVVGIS